MFEIQSQLLARGRFFLFMFFKVMFPEYLYSHGGCGCPLPSWPSASEASLQTAASVSRSPRTEQEPWKMLFGWQQFGFALENNFLLVDSTKLFPSPSPTSPKQKKRWKDSLGIIHSALPPVWDLAVCVHPPAQGRSEAISLGRICCWLNCTLSLSSRITNAVASLALASEKARSSACGLEVRGEKPKESCVENLILWERYRMAPGGLAQWFACCVVLNRSVAALDLCYLTLPWEVEGHGKRV